MPLFRKSQPTPAVAAAPTKPGRNSQESTSSTTGSSRRSGGGFFSRSSVDSSSPTSTSPSHHAAGGSGKPSLFSRHLHTPEDPSITAARQRIASAEQAEHEADRALVAARASVRDAHEHVAMLEREAAEEARLAKIKQGAAKDIGKRAKPLGRHGHF